MPHSSASDRPLTILGIVDRQAITLDRQVSDSARSRPSHTEKFDGQDITSARPHASSVRKPDGRNIISTRPHASLDRKPDGQNIFSRPHLLLKGSRRL